MKQRIISVCLAVLLSLVGFGTAWAHDIAKQGGKSAAAPWRSNHAASADSYYQRGNEPVEANSIKPGVQYVLNCGRPDSAGEKTFLMGTTFSFGTENLPKECVYTFEAAGKNTRGEDCYYLMNSDGLYFTNPGRNLGYTFFKDIAWKVTVKAVNGDFEPDYEYTSCDDNGDEMDYVGMAAYRAEWRDNGEPLDLSDASFFGDAEYGVVIAGAEPDDRNDICSAYTYLVGLPTGVSTGNVSHGTNYHNNVWVIYTVHQQRTLENLEAVISELFPNGWDPDTYRAGTAPGCYSQEAIDAVTYAYEEAIYTATDETADALASALIEAYEAFLASYVECAVNADINGDNLVDAADYRFMIDVLLNPYTTSASESKRVDLNGNGKADVGDASIISDVIRGIDVSKKLNPATDKLGTFSFTVPDRVPAGTSLEIPIYLTDARPLRDVQFRVGLNLGNAKVTGVECNLEGYALDINKISDDERYQLVIHSLSGAMIEGDAKKQLCTLKVSTDDVIQMTVVPLVISVGTVSHADGTISTPALVSKSFFVDAPPAPQLTVSEIIEGKQGDIVTETCTLTTYHDMRDMQIEFESRHGASIEKVECRLDGYTMTCEDISEGLFFKKYRLNVVPTGDAIIAALDADNGTTYTLADITFRLPYIAGYDDTFLDGTATTLDGKKLSVNGNIIMMNVAEGPNGALIADVNGDGVANAEDYKRSLDVILGRYSSDPDDSMRADINSDGKVNVGDVSLITDAIRGVSLDERVLYSGTDNVGKISMTAVNAAGGTIVDVPVFLEDSKAVRDVQFEILVPSNITLRDVKCTYEGYTAEYEQLYDRSYRVVISSLTGAAMDDVTNKQVCVLQLSTEDVVQSQNGLLIFSNFFDSHPDGRISAVKGYSQTFRVTSLPAPELDVPSVIEGICGETVTIPLSLSTRHNLRTLEFNIESVSGVTIENVECLLDGYTVTSDNENEDMYDDYFSIYRLKFEPTADTYIRAGENEEWAKYPLANLTLRLPEQEIHNAIMISVSAMTPEGKSVYVNSGPTIIKSFERMEAAVDADLNGDKVVDAADYRRMLDILLGLYTPDADETKRADLNGDGKVNVSDASIISDVIRGLDVRSKLNAATDRTGKYSCTVADRTPVGQPVEIPIYLTDARPIRDIQFKLRLVKYITLSEVKCSYEGYTTEFVPLGNDEYMVVISSLSGAMMDDGSKKNVCTLVLSTDEVIQTTLCSMWLMDITESHADGTTSAPPSFLKGFFIDAIPAPEIETTGEREVEMGETIVFPLVLSTRHNLCDIEVVLGCMAGIVVEGAECRLEGYTMSFALDEDDGFFCYYRLKFEPSGDAFIRAGENGEWAKYALADLTLKFSEEEDFAELMTDGSAVTPEGKSVSIYGMPTIFEIKAPKYKLTLDFKKGWNWFSHNLADCPELLTKSFAETFPTGVSYVASQYASMVYNDEEDVWYGSLRPGRDSAYKVYAEKDVTYQFAGTPVECASSAIYIYSGWTWIAYSPAVPMLASEALAPMTRTEGDVIKGQHSSAVYHDGTWIGDFMMEPGQGYLYRSLSERSQLFRYPTVSASYYKAPARISNHAEDGGCFDFDVHQFSDNMAIVTRIADADAHRYVVGVFNGEECRGKSVADQGYHIVTAHGQGGDALQFVILDTMTDAFYQAVDAEGEPLMVPFNGASAGTPSAPIILSLGARMGDIITGVQFPSSVDTDHTPHDGIYSLDGRRTTHGRGVVIDADGRKSFVK